MNTSNRRRFLRDTALLTGTVALSSPPSLHAQGANDRLRLGIIGPGGMGLNHLRTFATYPDVQIAFVCDPDAERLAAAASETAKLAGEAPKPVKDMRGILEVETVDAVVIATPDHWHVPAALLALEAGKHVYVEKPCSHNIREGRLSGRRPTPQHRAGGDASRSADYLRRAMERLREAPSASAGRQGLEQPVARQHWPCSALRSAGPPRLRLWVGPAPWSLQSNLLHSSWRWFTAFGCGDAGNDGVHELDLARWGLGVNTHPNTIAGLGGKYFFDDDQQFPDTQYVTFEYEAAGRKRQLVYEHRIWSPYVQEGYENGNAFYGTKGMMILGKQSGWQLYGTRNKLNEEQRGSLSLTAHHRDFLDAIRTGQLPNADAETGHLSAALAHFANIATRLGTTLRFDPAKERFMDNDDANRLLRRTYRKGIGPCRRIVREPAARRSSMDRSARRHLPPPARAKQPRAGMHALVPPSGHQMRTDTMRSDHAWSRPPIHRLGMRRGLTPIRGTCRLDSATLRPQVEAEVARALLILSLSTAGSTRTELSLQEEQNSRARGGRARASWFHRDPRCGRSGRGWCLANGPANGSGPHGSRCAAARGKPARHTPARPTA
jgi:predicted dehydrogenase